MKICKNFEEKNHSLVHGILEYYTSETYSIIKNQALLYYSQLCLNRQLYKIDTLEKQKPGVGHVLPLFESALRDGHLSKMDIFACSASPKTCLS